MKKDSYLKKTKDMCFHMTEVLMMSVVIYAAVALKIYRDGKNDKRKSKRNY